VLEGRGQILKILVNETSEITIMNDAYNANLCSMLAGLKSLEAYPGNRKVAVVGDMLDLGKDSVAIHEKLFESLDQSCIDLVYAVGQFVKSPFEKLSKDKKGKCFPNSDGVGEMLISNIHHGDVIWLKASHSVCFRKIVEFLQKSENFVAREVDDSEDTANLIRKAG
jgi:UDP-N-acetylmuramoyl-tripeptide--D-alanyl-D-alanine ligase